MRFKLDDRQNGAEQQKIGSAPFSFAVKYKRNFIQQKGPSPDGPFCDCVFYENECFKY